jgi:di/tricarboxylate transporter
MIATLIILALSAVFFAVGKVRSDLVALCALVCLLLTGVLTPQEALSGFSNPVVIMMVGLFVVGGAIFQTGLAKKISGKILSLAGESELRLFILLMVVTAAIGAFVSNTGTVALMMPIVVSLAAKSKTSSSRLLMPLAFASSMGGMLTLIGTPPNLVIQEALTEAGYAPLSFFSFTPIGIICIVVGIVVLLPLSKIFLTKGDDDKGKRKRGKSLAELVKEYHINEKLSVVKVTPQSPALGKTLAQLDLHNRYGLTVLEIRRERTAQHRIIKNVEQRLAGPDTALCAGDMLFLSGDSAQAQQLAAEQKFAAVSDQGNAATANKGGRLAFYDIGIAEILLMPNSRLINRQLRESGFRALYNVNVVGIRRNDDYITTDLPNLRLMPNDILLVQGTWKNIGRLSDEADNWVVIGQPLEEAAKVEIDYKAPIAGIIMLLMVAMMVIDSIPIAPVTAVMIAALLMVATGCLRNVEAAYKTINWESIVLIAAMLPMSVALEKTGVSSLISQTMVTHLGPFGPYALLAGVYFTTSLLTLFISNTATAVLMAPIAITAAQGIGISPYPLLFAVTLGASMCFASPFSTPPNALVMKAGQYSFADYLKVGLPLQVIIGIVMLVALPMLFPF